MLEETGTLGPSVDRNPTYLDKLQVEKQRGITVKAQAATMVYNYKGEQYMLNLIDTPVRPQSEIASQITGTCGLQLRGLSLA